MDHVDWEALLSAVGYITLAAVGGALGHVMREHDKGNPLNGWRALTESVSSGFVGFLVMMLCLAMGLDPLWTGPIVGLCGWLGANVTIRMLERVVYERFGLKLRANTDKRVAAGKAQEEDRA